MRNRMGSSLNLDTTVVGLQGLPISTTPPAAGQALVFDGTDWVPTTVATGGAIVPVNNVLPASPSVGELYWDLTTAKLFLWDGTQWVATINTPEGSVGPPGPAGPPGATGPAGPAPTPPFNGPIIGVTDGSNAAAGMVGEVLSASGSPTLGMAQGTSGALQVATITLTPGDWDVYYFGNLNYTVGTTGASITSEGYVQLGVSGQSISNVTSFRFYPEGAAQSPQPPIEFVLELIGGGSNTFRVNVTASTALALNASLFLSTALSNAWGSAVQQLNGTLWARRVR